MVELGVAVGQGNVRVASADVGGEKEASEKAADHADHGGDSGTKEGLRWGKEPGRPDEEPGLAEMA